MPSDVYQISVKAIVVRPDGKVLGLNGKVGGLFEGFYDLPGGRIEQSEFTTPIHEIIKREIMEETGLSGVVIEEHPISLGRHLSRQGDRVMFVFYRAQLAENTDAIKISSEHEGFAWLDLNESNLETYFKSGILEGMRGYLAQK